MLLRLLASISLAILFLLGLCVSVATVFDGVTLYSTRYSLAGNAESVVLVMMLLLAVLVVGVLYFKRYSLRALWFQPYLNVVVMISAGLLVSVSEFGPETAKSLDTVNVIVLPEKFIVAGEEGANVVALVEEELSRYSGKKPQLLLSAESNIGYRRIQGALEVLRDAGYQNVGLVSNSLDAR